MLSTAFQCATHWKARNGPKYIAGGGGDKATTYLVCYHKHNMSHHKKPQWTRYRGSRKAFYNTSPDAARIHGLFLPTRTNLYSTTWVSLTGIPLHYRCCELHVGRGSKHIFVSYDASRYSRNSTALKGTFLGKQVDHSPIQSLTANHNQQKMYIEQEYLEEVGR